MGDEGAEKLEPEEPRDDHQNGREPFGLTRFASGELAVPARGSGRGWGGLGANARRIVMIVVVARVARVVRAMSMDVAVQMTGIVRGRLSAFG